MNSAYHRYFFVMPLVLVVILAVGAPVVLLAQAGSGDAEILPKKAEAESTQTTKTTGVTSAPGSTPQPTPGDDLSPFSLSVVILSMLVGGLLLLFVEVALIPGFGVTGISGIVVIGAGLGLSFWKLDLRLAIIYTILSILALIGLILWAIYIFPHTATGKKFVLETRISVEDGYTTSLDLQKYVGQEGTAASDLRPSGIARIGDERLDVVSDGDFIPRGTKIKVIQAKQTNLVVARVQPEEPSPSA